MAGIIEFTLTNVERATEHTTILRDPGCTSLPDRYSRVALSVGQGDNTEGAIVEPTDRLYVPHRKRMSHAYVTTEDGRRELCIYYGVKEVSFDEDRLFAFGEQLVQQTSFIAGSATAWGPGYEWSELQPLFEALVAEGIIKRGETVDDARGGGLVPSLLPPSSCPVHRSWTADECPAITRDLAGRAVEIGNLEAVLSVYRVAHPALDGDGRQVGEANVFPPALRMDFDTEWRVCQYPGSRYRDDAPMNVTALKAMIKHWKPMMAVLREVRRELASRLDRSRQGWTVGDLHLFSSVLLALPGFQLMSGGAAPSSPVHPVLSSLFRIADGIRMTTHLMLFLSEERTRAPEEPTTATELYEFAERNGLLLSSHGVCAGPKPMIEEFLNTVFEDPSERRSGTPGERVAGVEHAPEVAALLARLPEAVDYALLGLQSWAVTRSVWLAMSLVYRELRAMFSPSRFPSGTLAASPPAVTARPGTRDPAGDRPEGFDAAPGAAGACDPLQMRLDADWTMLDRERIAKDYERDVHAIVYRDTYEQSWRGLGHPQGAASLSERIAPVPSGPEHAEAARQLRAILAARLASSRLAGAVDRIVGLLIDYLRQEQAILRAAAELQAEINARLERPRPRRPLTARDLRVTFAMYGGVIAKFPYLFDTLGDELGFEVESTADAIAIVDRRAGQLEREPPVHSGAPVSLQ